MTQSLAAVDGSLQAAERGTDLALILVGGMKQSGIGRDGVRSAIEHMTEEKLISFNGN